MYQFSVYLLEMRLRVFYILVSLILTVITCYHYQFEILYLIGRPFLELDHKFVLIDLTEAFYTILRTCGILSFLLMLPFFFYHFWSFYIPSRYNYERIIMNKLSLLFFFLLFMELLILYFLIFPKICDFLLSFENISAGYHNDFAVGSQNTPFFLNQQQNQVIDISNKLSNGKLPVLMELTARLESYVQLSIRFYFIMLTLFQIPPLILILYYYNILECYILCKFRKFFLFCSLLISAFISPPDIISQCLLTFLLFLFYELLVFLGIFHYKLLNEKS